MNIFRHAYPKYISDQYNLTHWGVTVVLLYTFNMETPKRAEQNVNSIVQTRRNAWINPILEEDRAG